MRRYTHTAVWTGVLLLFAAAMSLDSAAQPSDFGGRSFFGSRGTSDQSSSSRSSSSQSRANWLEDAIIEADPETGSIMVIADEETGKQIEKVIQNLDRPVPQVLIKVLFLEVTHSKGLDLGVEAQYQWDKTGERETIETLFGVAAESRGAFFHVIEEDFTATLRALAEVGKLEVLSRPSILARNNEPAIITVGQEVPFIRNSRVTQDGQTINTVEYEDIGIILEVTPFISNEGLVEMDVAPEISTLTGDTVPISDGVDAPVFAKRSAETRVVVPDGQTVVIGGLMEDQETETVQKIPLLGDIPYLGGLFRRTIQSKAKTELLIFLTPTVVQHKGSLAEMTKKETDKAEVAPRAFSVDEMNKYVDDADIARSLGTPSKKDKQTTE